ncbi:MULTISPECIES: hypothetical protein [Acinetobacter]|nr:MULTISPECIES: hypothetical protein [Acinetobacter]ENV53363.1 hypothetical protein F952_02424 [Acinetobacter baylyi DSM 14961 = CIP 107474]KAF2370719.1 hypothetical protein BSL88_08875 [Acinetobacter baylyi]KAF2375143.1 hypothetical protein BSL67_02265 [Acinetobacter baylyi]KAF2378488.1 hypothetical protein BSN81_03545 [Acinetobacter baylyi]KAF2380019.1 hypothetical protein BSN83_12040 [Acinetobacter baylyi]
MIKKIISVLVLVLVVVTSVMIVYWKDSQFDPSAQDIWLYLVILPLVLGSVLLAPWLLFKAYRAYRQRQQELAIQKEITPEKSEIASETTPEWITLNVFSSYAFATAGENNELLDAIMDYQSPQLDTELVNAYGLPILSYRITDLTLEQNETEYSARQQRIRALITQQIQQQHMTLLNIAEHLKHSSLFYETEHVQAYRMHPAWINEQYTDQEEDSSQTAPEPVSQLTRLNVHIFLPEDLLHFWNDDENNDFLNQQLIQLGFIPEKIFIEYQFVSAVSAYTEWNELLKRIAIKTDEVTLVVSVDSEIDQELIEERFWQHQNYIPSEFIASCCLAAESVLINSLQPLKQLKLCTNHSDTALALNHLQLHDLPQYQDEQPFVFILEQAADFGMSKSLDQHFNRTSIEPHHYLYACSLIGHTQQVSKIYGAMLALQTIDQSVAFIFSRHALSTFTVVQNAISEIEQEEEAA